MWPVIFNISQMIIFGKIAKSWSCFKMKCMRLSSKSWKPGWQDYVLHRLKLTDIYLDLVLIKTKKISWTVSEQLLRLTQCRCWTKNKSLDVF